MALTVDYKDAIYSQKKYRLQQNADGTVSFTDATDYTQQGDRFGAKDINSTNQEINRLCREVRIRLSAAAWSPGNPYTQTVDVAGMRAIDTIIVGKAIDQNTDPNTARLYDKMFGYLSGGEAQDGKATFYCAYKRPVADFEVTLRGVSA